MPTDRGARLMTGPGARDRDRFAIAAACPCAN